MHKGDLVNKLSGVLTGHTKAGIERMVNATLEAMSEALGAGNSITLIGFGTFKVVKRAARDGVNPQTGKKIRIPSCNVVKFKPGKKLKDKVN